MAGTQGAEGIGVHHVAGKCVVDHAWEPMQGCGWEGAVRIVVHSGRGSRVGTMAAGVREVAVGM